MALIVVVDDDRDIADLVSAYLRREGHMIRTSHSGTDGLDLILELRPDLAVIDWMMPGLDGLEVARAVRAEAGLAQTRLLMMTARSAPGDREQAFAAGFDEIVSKPFRRPDVVAAVARLV